MGNPQREALGALVRNLCDERAIRKRELVNVPTQEWSDPELKEDDHELAGLLMQPVRR